VLVSADPARGGSLRELFRGEAEGADSSVTF